MLITQDTYPPPRRAPIYLKHAQQQEKGAVSPVSTADETAKQEEEKLYCAVCDTWVTSGPWRISVNGSHAHTFFNPAGIIFKVGCFKEAPGARPIGQPSSEFTWFKGHKWRAALCGSCQEHLGWLFDGNSLFFCLILKKLTSQPPQSRPS
jgi:hypothetical protein